MENYVVTSDSTCDLNADQIKNNNIQIKCLSIILGGKEYADGIDIDSQRILDYVDNGGDLPKTAATSVEDYKEFFSKFVNEGKKVIHFNISSQASSCYANACVAAKEIGNVFVVDSRNLSSGQGLLVLKACDLLKEGKSVEEAYDEILGYTKKVQLSFVVDRLDFLHKGGRCSLIQLIGAKLLKLHPCIYMPDGALKIKKKYTGSIKRSFDSYVNDLAQEYATYNKQRCFVTHCKADPDLVEMVVAKVKELFEFNEIIVSEAGATITSHCGRNTLGVLFLTE